MQLMKLSLFLIILGYCAPLSLAQPRIAAAEPSSTVDTRVIPQHPELRRLIFLLIADGFEGHMKMLERGENQDATSFLRHMTQAYKNAQLENLPRQYQAYISEMLQWLEQELPLIEGEEAIFTAYEEKQKQLAEKYRQAHATLTSQNNEFKNLLDESGISALMQQDLMERQDAYRAQPKETLIEHYRHSIKLLRNHAEQLKEHEASN